MRRDLEQLEQRWGLALQSAGFGIWDLDVPTQTVHYSPQWKAMLGYGHEDAPDSTAAWRSRVHPDDLPAMLAALSHHLSGQHPNYEMEFRLRAADGSYRWVLSRGRVVSRDGEGAPLRAVGTLTDLTDRHQAETMRRARDLAESASRAKSEFLGRMSHELRTPLNAVLGFAQLIAQQADGADAQEARRHAGQIERAGWHLLHMIDNVLDLSRLESGRLDITLARVELAPLVQASIDQAAPLASRHGVHLVLDPLPADVHVMADAHRLRQMLHTLLDNAIKYNRPGGSVRIVAQAEERLCRLAVSDTGSGIPTAQLPRLFEPFNRLGRSDIDGAGIGLVLVKSLVAAMGGSVSVHSVEGEGSTFELQLHLASR
ncbi:MAG: PAS domain S-box protein [Rubrivivax sp.]|nr:MAG: PAS domain S-box protein [Rubrivivax sp.]